MKPVLFLDNYDLLNHHELLSLKWGKSRAVFLEEISPEGYSLHQIALFRKKVFEIMEFKLRAYQAGWIRPTES